MKVYTKTGDNGTTSLFGGDRLLKSDLRVDAYGNIDELNSHLGYFSDLISNHYAVDHLLIIQNLLFDTGSILATVDIDFRSKLPKINETHIKWIEDLIDRMQADLKPMNQFILPSGHPSVSYCHIVRTVCRRAERVVVDLYTKESDTELEIIISFLNRLSDYFFVLSRHIAYTLNISENVWKKNIKL